MWWREERKKRQESVSALFLSVTSCRGRVEGKKREKGALQSAFPIWLFSGGKRVRGGGKGPREEQGALSPLIASYTERSTKPPVGIAISPRGGEKREWIPFNFLLPRWAEEKRKGEGGGKEGRRGEANFFFQSFHPLNQFQKKKKKRGRVT